MPQQGYDRYKLLKNNDGTISAMPFVELPTNASDKFEYWNVARSRMDRMSQKYYGNPFYDFLILYANPQFVSEFDIPDNALVRIPFPLQVVLSQYESEILRIKNQ